MCKGFCGFAPAVHDRVLFYAKLKLFELCFNWKGLARGWKNQNETLWDHGEGSTFVLEGKETALRCPLQPPSEMGPYSLSTDDESDEFLKCVVKTEIVKERRESTRTVGKEEKCVNKMPKLMFEAVDEAYAQKPGLGFEAGGTRDVVFSAWVPLDFDTDDGRRRH